MVKKFYFLNLFNIAYSQTSNLKSFCYGYDQSIHQTPTNFCRIKLKECLNNEDCAVRFSEYTSISCKVQDGPNCPNLNKRGLGSIEIDSYCYEKYLNLLQPVYSRDFGEFLGFDLINCCCPGPGSKCLLPDLNKSSKILKDRFLFCYNHNFTSLLTFGNSEKESSFLENNKIYNRDCLDIKDECVQLNGPPSNKWPTRDVASISIYLPSNIAGGYGYGYGPGTARSSNIVEARQCKKTLQDYVKYCPHESIDSSSKECKNFRKIEERTTLFQNPEIKVTEGQKRCENSYKLMPNFYCNCDRSLGDLKRAAKELRLQTNKSNLQVELKNKHKSLQKIHQNCKNYKALFMKDNMCVESFLKILVDQGDKANKRRKENTKIVKTSIKKKKEKQNSVEIKRAESKSRQENIILVVFGVFFGVGIILLVGMGVLAYVKEYGKKVAPGEEPRTCEETSASVASASASASASGTGTGNRPSGSISNTNRSNSNNSNSTTITLRRGSLDEQNQTNKAQINSKLGVANEDLKRHIRRNSIQEEHISEGEEESKQR